MDDGPQHEGRGGRSTRRDSGSDHRQPLKNCEIRQDLREFSACCRAHSPGLAESAPTLPPHDDTQRIVRKASPQRRAGCRFLPLETFFMIFPIRLEISQYFIIELVEMGTAGGKIEARNNSYGFRVLRVRSIP